METEYERLKKQFDRIEKNRNSELIDSYINILSKNEQEILSLNTELDDRDNLITKLYEKIVELEELNAELKQTIIAKTQREIILENRLANGDK